MRYSAPNWLIAGIASLALFAPSALPQQQAMTDAQQQQVLKVAKEVRKAIVSQTRFGVFDSINFGIQGTDTVILRGYASRPVLKSDTENAVKRIEGVKTVKNEIEVLPLSNMDDRIRAAVYASIYSFAPLQKYTANRGGGSRMPSVARAAGGITNDPPTGFHAIHIIVKNGNVTLTGAVLSDSDLAMAEMRANQVAGVFSVTNELQVEERS